MGDHYYTAQPESGHKPLLVEAEVLGQRFSFETDAGVFSRTELDPGSRLLIESMPALQGNILDMGCGWGPVGVILARANPGAHVLLTDVNQRAVYLASRNILKNSISNASAQVSDGFDRIEGQFDHIVTNPPIRAGKQTIYALFDEAAARLTPGGTLSIVIRKQQGAPSALKHIQGILPQAEIAARAGGYWIIRGVRKEEDTV